MKTSNLRNTANKSGIIEDKNRHEIQQNVVTKLNKKSKGVRKHDGELFCICHTNRRNNNQHLKLLYFKLNSHFGLSN